jgi:hypothetical protein
MQRACGASFALHLNHMRDRTPDVGFDLRRPLIRPLSHGRRRRNGINGNYFIDAVSDAGCRLVPVDSYLASSHLFTPLVQKYLFKIRAMKLFCPAPAAA